MVKSYLEIPKKLFKKDILQLILVMLLLIVFLYFISDIKAIFLFSLLIIFYFSKPEKDFFWIIIAFILIDYPMNLFWHIQKDVFRFSIIELSFIHVFSIVALIKINVKAGYPKLNHFLKKPFLVYTIWLVVLLIIGLINGIKGGGETGYRYLYDFGKTFLVFPLFISIPKMLNDNKSLRRFINLIFFLMIINFIGQLLSIVFKQNIHLFLGGHIPVYWDTNIYYSRNDLIRPTFGAYTHFLALFISTFYYFSKNTIYNKRFLIIIMLLSYLSCVIMATRGWFIAYSVFMLLVLLHTLANKILYSTILKITIISIPILLIIISNPTFNNQFSKVFERFSTIEYLFEGDLTARETVSRLTTRSFPIMEKFYERPIIGWGFSKTGMKTADGHVGNQSILVIGGIIGFLIIIYIWTFVIIKIYKIYNSISSNNIYKNSILIVNFALITLIIIHSSSGQVFGYYLYSSGANGPIAISIFFTIINIFYYQTLTIEKIIRK